MYRLGELAPRFLVATSDVYTCISTVVIAADKSCLVIDPALSVTELAALAADLHANDMKPVSGFATHPHWDHVLWSRELGADVPRYAAPAAVSAARAGRESMIERVQEEAPGHDLDLFGGLTVLTQAAIPWDGPRAEPIVHDGHAPGHAAVFFPGAGVLAAGDMLSDIEIPLLDIDAPDPLGDYSAGLDRLAAIAEINLLIPGHGHVGDTAEFRRRVDADRRYLDRLAAGRPFEDPRCTEPWLREHHELQLARVRQAPRGGGRG